MNVRTSSPARAGRKLFPKYPAAVAQNAGLAPMLASARSRILPARGAEEQRSRGEGRSRRRGRRALAPAIKDPDLMPVDSPQRVIQECGGQQDRQRRRDCP